MFGIPLSLCSDPGTQLTTEVIQHLCKWLSVTIYYGPADPTTAQGAVERMGGWIHETLVELYKTWSQRWDEYVKPSIWLHRTTPNSRLPGKATAFGLLFGHDCRTQMDATISSPDVESLGKLRNPIADHSKAIRQVQGVYNDLQHHMSKDDCDESTRTYAPLQEPE